MFNKNFHLHVRNKEKAHRTNFGLLLLFFLSFAITWVPAEFIVLRQDQEKANLLTSAFNLLIPRLNVQASNTVPWVEHGYLQVSSNGHFLQYEDGTPFFWMGDTAWHMPSLSPSEVNTYVQNRKSLGFSVIHVTADNFDLRPDKEEPNDRNLPNYNGDHPFNGAIPFSSLNPNEKYWQHIDYIVDEAARQGMYIMLVSAWGFGLTDQSFTDPYELNYQYGQFLGNRYRDKQNIIYCVAGEFASIMGRYTALTDSTREGWLRRLGQGIDSAANSKQLITIHGNPGSPGSRKIPSDFFKDDIWLDFYGNQSWQQPKFIDDQIFGDFGLANPTKPTINLEPGYEGRPANANYICEAAVTPWGQRFQAYWSVFYGGFGHSYGHNRLAAMSGPSQDAWADRNSGILDPAALTAEGAGDMRHLKGLMESVALNARVPDQSIITSSRGLDTGNSPDLTVSTLGSDRTWAFVYLTKGGNVTVDLGKISGLHVQASWYNPRNGNYSTIGTYGASGTRTFGAPSSGENNDWVLVLRDD